MKYIFRPWEDGEHWWEIGDGTPSYPKNCYVFSIADLRRWFKKWVFK